MRRDPEQPYLVRKRRFVAVKHAGVVQQNLVSHESQQTVPEPGDDLAIAQRHGLRRDKHSTQQSLIYLFTFVVMKQSDLVFDSVLNVPVPDLLTHRWYRGPGYPVLDAYGRGVRY